MKITKPSIWKTISATSNYYTGSGIITGSLTITTGSSQANDLVASKVSITGGAISGITDLAITDGGTGQSTQTAAFNALSPLTSRGDIIYHDGTNNIRLVSGSISQALITTPTGLGWSTTGSGVTDHADLSNVTSDQHHSQQHTITGSDHAALGMTSGHFLKANAPETFSFQAHGLTASDVGAAQLSHSGSHQVGGNDAIGISVLTGSITAGQHGNLSGTSDTMHTWGSIDNVPSTYTPSSHSGSHQSGGDDQVSLSILQGGSTPTSGSAPGATGEIRWDQDYLYVCTGSTNGWGRTTLAGW